MAAREEVRDTSPLPGGRPQTGGLSVRNNSSVFSTSSVVLDAPERPDKSTLFAAHGSNAAPFTPIVFTQTAQTTQPNQPLNPDAIFLSPTFETGGCESPPHGVTTDHSEPGSESTKSAAAQSAAAAQASAAQAALAVLHGDEESAEQEEMDGTGFFFRHRRGYMAGTELYSQERRLSVASATDGMQKRHQMLGTTTIPAEEPAGAHSGSIASAPLPPTGLKAKLSQGMSEKFMRKSLRQIVSSPYFDFATTVLILLNAAVLGIQTDLMARSLSEKEPFVFKVSERLFCVLFTAEIVVKLYVARCSFFHQDDWHWHLFDVVVVGMQLLDVLFETILDLAVRSNTGSAEDDWRSNISIVRVLRILRLVRILRVLRTLRSISELRTIIVSIFGTLRTLLWTLLLLLLIMFMIAVTITQIVTYHLLQEANESRRESLQRYYGNLGGSILVLFQAITGGIDWRDMLAPLIEYISFWLVSPVCFYIGFGIFALMNIVTGVFVESALESAQREKERFLLHTVRALFQCTDEDHSGEISWNEFQAKLDHPAMHIYFKTIDLDIEEAEDLFHLIDIDDSGAIDPEEFVNGCIRLQGPAKAIDLATLMHEFKRSQKWHARRLRRLSSAVAPLSKVAMNGSIGVLPAPTQVQV